MLRVRQRSRATRTAPPREGGRILVASYAFPPLHVPMTPCVAKIVVGLAELGHAVDVVCAAPFDEALLWDPSLLPYVRRAAARIIRLKPSHADRLGGELRRRAGTVPDPMHLLARRATKLLARLPLEAYEAVLSFSPFHSINPVLAAMKQRRHDWRWIAQFSDPWARNPIETSPSREAWNRQHEPATIVAADHLAFTSEPARHLMLSGHGEPHREKTSIVSHSWDACLYPGRERARNKRVTLRHIGTLFGKRSPEDLFRGVRLLLGRRPELADRLLLDLVGEVEPKLLESETARALPEGMVQRRPAVSYLKSLELMYDADALVLIEPEVSFNLFVPSKLADYVGADRPIIALSPPGASRELLTRLGVPYCSPTDTAAIAAAIERVVDEPADPRLFRAGEQERAAIATRRVAADYAGLVARVAAPQRAAGA